MTQYQIFETIHNLSEISGEHMTNCLGSFNFSDEDKCEKFLEDNYPGLKPSYEHYNPGKEFDVIEFFSGISYEYCNDIDWYTDVYLLSDFLAQNFDKSVENFMHTLEESVRYGNMLDEDEEKYSPNDLMGRPNETFNKIARKLQQFKNINIEEER